MSNWHRVPRGRRRLLVLGTALGVAALWGASAMFLGLMIEEFGLSEWRRALWYTGMGIAFVCAWYLFGVLDGLEVEVARMRIAPEPPVKGRTP